MKYNDVKKNIHGTEEEYQSTQEWSKILTETIPNILKHNVEGKYKIKGSYGQPKNWSYVPWIGIFDLDMTDSSQKGVYLVYLFKADLSGFYLSLCLGTDYFEQFGKRKLDLINTASEDVKNILIDNFDLNDFEFNIDLASNKKRPKAYEQGTVFAKYYDKNNLPSEEEFYNDLELFLEFYKFIKPYDLDKLYPELSDVSSTEIDVEIGEETEKPNYWIFAPGEQANNWDEQYQEGIMAIAWDIEDLKNFNSREEINEFIKKSYNDHKNHPNDSLCLWEFANKIKPGDIIFAKRGSNEIIGRGYVTSDYIYDETKKQYKHIRKVNWVDNGSWIYKYKNQKLPQKTLTNMSNSSYDQKKLEIIKGFFDEKPYDDGDKYTEENFLNEVYIDDNDYEKLVKLLKNKKNLIVQGAPGVGKTFLAKRLAYSRIGEKDPSRVMMVQFHQSYSYEDFVMGYRPSKDGFELREGSFYNFCKKAEEDDENEYFFIIDEINRGNLSKIFGELFMLIENDKRGEKNKIQLLYSDELFYIPKNLYIIGLMNTADRSLALIDYALRRRFAFFDLKPGFSSKGFKSYQESLNSKEFDKLIEIMKDLNKEIKDDETLGEGFRIGHSYFCNLNKEDNIKEDLDYIIDFEIIPLLKEYWFDENDKFKKWESKLKS
ncbi:MrcB family domain-containing protein [uncultured Methanobrevibacter sp.]|uniref:MrcB family domain-containing protein n=1 Tax=uncultured Methanobrevibacter sp. TaxID=253161 RepID=UPI00261C2CF3